MSELYSFPYDKEKFADIRGYRFGKNWPVVYIMEDGAEAYVGETVNAYNRSRQHHEKPERRKLKTIHILSDEEFNKSAALDIESWIIQYMAADQKYILQNGNGGLKNHNYFDRDKYKAKFELAWRKMREIGLANNTLPDLKNSDLFKYSPYKSLTEDQFLVARAIRKSITQNPSGTTHMVHGRPGTGKTILATYLFKYLKEQEDTKDMEIALVVPMTSLRTTIKAVFRKIKGLSSTMVIGPNDVVKKEYDLLIVDESHRLQRRKNIMGMGAYDQVNKKLGLPKEATNLDWIMKSSKHQIFFYDENQSIKPADIRKEDFQKLNVKEYKLTTQMRMEAGEDFVTFVDAFFAQTPIHKKDFGEYDFQIYDDIEQMAKDIKAKDKEHGLSRLVAGYAWPWQTKKGKEKYDIEIAGFRGIWNTTNTDWVNSPNAVNEVGCIHTVQGYDLNYVGVIIGPEFGYDPKKKEFFVDRKQYFDRNGYAGVHDPEELLRYIINIYKTLLTRGIKGVYLYAVDPELRNYFKNLSSPKAKQSSKITTLEIQSPYVGAVVSLPLYDSVGCGEATYADPISHEVWDVPKSLISQGAKYFVLRTSGDSMNELGIEDGDLILCQKNYQAPSGSVAVVLIGDDATLKEIKYEPDGMLLIPRSTNKTHKTRKLIEGDEFKVLGVFMRKLQSEE